MKRNDDSIIGSSPALASALEHLSSVAGVDRPVLILGERGTGKELAAARLHFLSPRWEGPFIKVNCAAVAETLLESELFGYEPGAFTGATRTHRGRFERADGGTLFLDELASMSGQLQEKLLRLVEYGEFERLGGQKTLQVDVRIIGATNENLGSAAGRRRFREDLLDRLSFDVIHLPALRQRPEDIPELARHFAMQMCSELGWPLFPGFTAVAERELLAHRWPGNVRELKNAVERSVYRWGDYRRAVGEIIADPFQSPFDESGGGEAAGAAAADARSLTDRVRDYERELLVQALEQHDQNQRRAAAALGLSYDQIRGLVRKHGLQGLRRRPRRGAAVASEH